MVFKMKNCPRCEGDTYIEKDTYGWYERCIQCGYLGFMENILEKNVSKTVKTKDSTRCLDRSVMKRDDDHKKPALAVS